MNCEEFSPSSHNVSSVTSNSRSKISTFLSNWATFDVDNSGALDKEETKKFVTDAAGNLSGCDEFSDKVFDEVFATFDKHGSEVVEKVETVIFIKQFLAASQFYKLGYEHLYRGAEYF